MAYRRTIELQANHSTALNNLGYILQHSHEDFDGAEGCFHRAIEADPRSCDARVNIATLLIHNREPPRWDSAVDHLEASLRAGGEKSRPLARPLARPPARPPARSPAAHAALTGTSQRWYCTRSCSWSARCPSEPLPPSRAPPPFPLPRRRKEGRDVSS
jgi:hypothetical protein